MTFASYTDLQTSAINWLKKPEITQQVPDFIAFAESTMNRRLRMRSMVGAAAMTLNGPTSLPNDFLDPVNLVLSDGRQLEPLTIDGLAERQMIYQPSTGEPTHYAISGGNIVLYPNPDASYLATFTYYQAIPPLQTNGNNWLLQAAPDAYLYGTLLQAAPYLDEDKRIGVWQSQFDRILLELKSSDMLVGGARLQTQPSLVV